MTATREVPHIDFLSGDFYLGARDTYRWLRDNAPVFFDGNSGLWGVATYESVVAVERDAATFSNAGGSRPDTGPLPWMIDLDGAAHTTRRRLVSGGFTPRRVRDTLPRLRGICDDLIDAVIEHGECDFVRDVASPLPMAVIGDMLGVPSADRAQLLAWSQQMLVSLGGAPDDYATAAEAFAAYVEYAKAAIAERRRAPTDDLFSVLVYAEADGARLSDDEIVFESLLLLIGGDETTRQVSAGGLEQLLLHPDQFAAVRADAALVPGAVEEMLRWVSPIKNMARTTTVAATVDGVTIPAHTKLIVLYESANFDERHFADPDRFDVRRSPNDHIAFGFGPHFCLGAALARAEITALVECVLARVPDVALAPDAVLNHTITGIEAMPVVFTPGPRA
jgi:cytochrome P450 family 142 subfamily A polypeptide 1